MCVFGTKTGCVLQVKPYNATSSNLRAAALTLKPNSLPPNPSEALFSEANISRPAFKITPWLFFHSGSHSLPLSPESPGLCSSPLQVIDQHRPLASQPGLTSS